MSVVIHNIELKRYNVRGKYALLNQKSAVIDELNIKKVKFAKSSKYVKNCQERRVDI